MFQRTQLLVSCALGALLVSASAAAAQTTDETSPIAAARVETVTATADATATDTTTDQSATTSQVGELMVTARLRTESVQKVPEAIIAITPEVLQDNEVTNFWDLQGFAPSLDVDTIYDKDFSTVFIRGFGAASFFAEAPAVPFSLYDISNVQILYGPQGTLFGYTALGGAILYEPNHPQMNRFGAGLDLTLGNLNEVNVNGYVNIPLVNDHLALRIAFEHDHTDGYTALQDSSTKLDSNDNEGARIELQWNPLGGRFTDFSFLQFVHMDDTPNSRIVTFINPLVIPNQCSGTNSEGGAAECYTATGYPEPLARAPTYYAADCTQGLLNALWAPGTTTAQCEAQHLAVLLNFGQQEIAAQALGLATGGRTEPGPIENAPLVQLAEQINYENVANYDIVHWSGLFGGGDIYLHDIANALWYRNDVTSFSAGYFLEYTASSIAYTSSTGAAASICVTGMADSAFPLTNPTLNSGATTGPNSTFCGQRSPPYSIAYTNELQIHGTLDTALGATPGVVWVAGLYGAGYPYPVNNAANCDATNVGGSVAINEGANICGTFSDGGASVYWGEYFQATVDFGMLWKPLSDFHLTGGIRFNENRVSTYTAPVANNTPVAQTIGGVPSTTLCNPQAATSPFPGSTACQFYYYGNFTAPVHSLVESKPINWSEEFDYTANGLMLYQETQYIVVPGFANALPTIPLSDVPGYQPLAGPEDLTDYEVGAKWNFNFANGVRGYADIDAYYEDLAHVQIGQVIQVPQNPPSVPTQTIVSYTANPANLIKKGVEFQGEVFPVPDLDIYANFSYADDYYTDYYDSDPYGYVYPTGYFPTNSSGVPYTISSGGTLEYSIAPGAVNSPLCVPKQSAATVAPGATVGTCILNLSSTRVPYAPYVQASVRMKYTVHLANGAGDVSPNFTVRYTSAENLTLTRPILRYEEILGPAIAQAFSQGPIAIVDARVDWHNPLGVKNMDVAAWVTNLFNTDYAFGAIDDDISLGYTTKTYAPPREFGIEISDKW